MAKIKKLVLDVLKPLEPDAIEFALALSKSIANSHVYVKVHELDKATETLILTIQGEDLEIDTVRAALADAGASLHSIDEVEAVNSED